MPELPEVETFVRALRQPLIGRSVVGVFNDWPRHIVTPDLPVLQARIRGLPIVAVGRRGKYLVFSLGQSETLIVHLKMSGHLSIAAANTPRDQHVHTVFELDNGHELRFKDIRKFGRVYLVDDPQRVLGSLGPEPLSNTFTAEQFRAMLVKRRRVLKPLLLDQSFIAGIGNIYADEALHYAKIHPARIASSLSSDESLIMHSSIKQVLELGINREGASIDDYRKPDGSMGNMQNAIVVYGRTGEPCYQCGTAIRRIVLGGRSTHYCPNCQPAE
jgi:formamidopyrimidine-DNA glycosylase